MIAQLPKVKIDSFTKKALSGGAFELEAAIENDGRWATLSAQAERTRRFSTPRIKLNLGGVAKVMVAIFEHRYVCLRFSSGGFRQGHRVAPLHLGNILRGHLRIKLW